MKGLCENNYSDKEINLILKDEPVILKKYNNLKMLSHVETNPLLKWCPKPDCGNYVEANNAQVT